MTVQGECVGCHQERTLNFHKLCCSCNNNGFSEHPDMERARERYVNSKLEQADIAAHQDIKYGEAS